MQCESRRILSRFLRGAGLRARRFSALGLCALVRHDASSVLLAVRVRLQQDDSRSRQKENLARSRKPETPFFAASKSFVCVSKRKQVGCCATTGCCKIGTRQRPARSGKAAGKS